MSKLEYISTICKTIYECSEERPQILVKYLPSIDRAQSVAENQETIDIVIKLLEDYSSVIVGLDLSGNPSSGNFNTLKPLLSQARHEGLKLSIHCAEITDRVDETREVLVFGVDRIGHGTFLDGSYWESFPSASDQLNKRLACPICRDPRIVEVVLDEKDSCGMLLIVEREMWNGGDLSRSPHAEVDKNQKSNCNLCECIFTS